MFELPPADRQIRVAGFDDAPFERDRPGSPVHVAGVICSGTRFEGMVWGTAAKDGFDATEVIADLLIGGKFLPQLHAVLLDGIAVGGLNVIDIADLAARLARPCIAVMRRMPDVEGFRRVIAGLPDPTRRLAMLDRAGEIIARPPFYYQVAGISADDAERLLARVTDTGHVPEALRLAHLIGAAVIGGESRGRA
jgi:hypothetical protein